MKKGLVFAVTLCAVFSVLSSAYVDKKRNKPPATVSPPFEFRVFNVQPNITKAEGSCKDPNANLTLTFKEGFITFLFHKNTTRNVVYVSEVSFKLTYPLGGKTSVYTATNKSLEIFSAAVGHSYSCRSESLLMKDGLYLDITHHRMQGFNISKTMDFGPPDACQADRPDYRVAIAVGVVLLVLIIVVVVAYLLSRRRRPDGYQPL
ncbi:hypothetical protein UPYG_G00242770 [Umbra pygmaea]|uniref:Lysosome-associated membrane glycoprotein 2-like luminal domain-containing protein n=1 Tax=Umbra pygmaea TaxID=75934 RepID=A0ABD0WL07_UMBPY